MRTGIAAGAVWNLGNFFSILAVVDESVGLAVSYPIMQCGLLVAGLWGIFWFQEIQGRQLICYWISVVVVVVGAVLLSMSK